MKRIIALVSITTTLISMFSSGAYAQQDEKNLLSVPVSTVLDQSVQYTKDKLTLELFNYEEYAYSKSRKTEVGDKMKLNTRFRYQVNSEAWFSMGFKTNPDVDRFANKTSDFEMRAGYNFENLSAQADFSLNTNDDSGSISFGLDLDSENTFLRYKFANNFQLTFFPFNFDGEVGVEFNTYDVTRIYYIQGAPSAVAQTPLPISPNEKIANKTIPGFVLRYNSIQNKKSFLSWYLGLGVATFEYPNDPNFDVRVSSTGNTWSRQETFGYKLGAVLRNTNSFTSFQYVGQSKDKETGVLLKSAASAYNLSYLSNFVLESELTASEGGRNPYRIDFSTNWFDQRDPLFANVNHRIYSNILGTQIQDWAGRWGWAGSLKFGLRRKNYRPYFSYKYQNKNFVFSGRESAQVLRTSDLSQSHGGLHRIGLGAYIYSGKFIINPRFEYLMAKNNVFSNSAVITNLNQLQSLKDKDYVFYINISYFYDKKTGPRTFRL